MQRHALLVIVAYHPREEEVTRLAKCLAQLSPRVGYAVVSNDHRPGEPVEALRSGADGFFLNQDNPGYGRAINQVVASMRLEGPLPELIGALNTDLAWQQGTFETLLDWLLEHPEVSVAVPQLVDPQGVVQLLCKPNPTVLGLFSRRFIPELLKPGWLRRYDQWYVMADRDYNSIFEVPYLSGCCMLMRTKNYLAAGGFDDRFFLYLEDADITRSLAAYGRALHLPVASVVHHWGRGNHRNWKLTLVNFHSVWLYFSKWGWKLW
jgi:GT2 family glycosyltransferase